MSFLLRSSALLLVVGQLAAVQRSGNLQILEDASRKIAQHELSDAERELRDLLGQDATEHRAEDLLGVIHAERGEEVLAERDFRAAMANSELAGPRINLALLLERKQELLQAADLFEAAYKIDPAREDARRGMVRVLRNDARASYNHNETEKALADLLRARKYAPNDPDVLYEFGIVCLRQNLYLDAEPALAKAVELRPNFAAAYYALGRAQIGNQEFAEAEKSMVRYNELQPNDATALYGLGLVASLQKRSEDARRYFEQSILLQPAQTESWYELGMLDLGARQLQKAEDEFQHVLNRNPRHTGALLGLAQCLFQERRYADAKAQLDAALSVDPNLSKAHYYLGLTMARLGDAASSTRELQIADRLQHEEFDRNRVQMRLAEPPKS